MRKIGRLDLTSVEMLGKFSRFVRDRWHSFQVDGWGGYVLKEKFKLIKLALKDWHLRHSRNLPAKILSLKDKDFFF